MGAARANVTEAELLRKPLVVAADASELVGVPEDLAAVVGVGILTSAAQLTRCLCTSSATCVILVGSCGAYSWAEKLRIGDVVAPKAFRLVDWGACTGRAQVPDAMVQHACVDAQLYQLLITRCTTRVVTGLASATTMGISVADDVSPLKQHACDVENMEGACLAAASALCEVPFAALLGVTNFVGSQGRGDWSKHRADVAERVTRELLHVLRPL